MPILVILLADFKVVMMWVTNKKGIGEMRRPDGFRLRLQLAHKLSFFAQVIGLFIVKLVIFDTRNVILCVDIRIVVFWSSYKWICSKIKSVLLFQVSAGAHIDLLKINIYRVPIFGSI